MCYNKSGLTNRIFISII